MFKWSSLSPTIIVKKTIPSLTPNISMATRLSHLYRSGLQDSRLDRTSGKGPKHFKQPPLPECKKYCHDQLCLSNREKRAAMGINTESLPRLPSKPRLFRNGDTILPPCIWEAQAGGSRAGQCTAVIQCHLSRKLDKFKASLGYTVKHYLKTTTEMRQTGQGGGIETEE